MMQGFKRLCTRVTWPLMLAAFAGGCLLLSLARLYANNLGTLLFTMAVGPLACAAAGLILFTTGLPRQSEFRLLLGLLAVVFLSSALNEKFYGAFTDNRNDLFTLTTLIFVCYALCFALPADKRMGALNGLIDVSAALVGVVALAGCVLAVYGSYVLPAFLPEYGIGISPAGVAMGADGRLVLFTHPNSTGMICEITLLLNVYRILTARHGHVKWLHGITALVCFCAVALAASRTATIAMAGGLGLYACRLILLRPVRAGKPRWARLLAAVAVFVLTLAAAYLINGLICDALLSISPNNAMTEAAAAAAERDILEDIGMFTGRTNLWKGALQAMRETPRLFLIGTSPIRVGAVVSPYTPIYAQELHNSFVQMLVAGGALCPLLFFAFLALLAWRSVRLYLPALTPNDLETACCGGVGFLPIPLAAILVNACMETFLAIYPQLVFASVWFFILAGYVVCTARDASGRVSGSKQTARG